MSMEVVAGLQDAMLAWSRSSSAYFCWERKKPAEERSTEMPRKKWRGPMSFMENSRWRREMVFGRSCVEDVVRTMSST